MDQFLSYYHEQIAPYLKVNDQYVFAAIIIVAIIGIILGLTKKITVFRDFNDLALVFFLIASPFFLVQIFRFFSDETVRKILLYFFVALEVLIFLTIVFRTFQDNSNPVFSMIALLIKIPLSVLFIINVLDFINPPSKSPQSNNVRRRALTWLLFLTPLIIALVRDKKGIFNPDKLIAGETVENPLGKEISYPR